MSKQQLEWLLHANNMFRGIDQLYPYTGIEQRFYQNLKYSDRVFDALARILLIHGACCAVLPLIEQHSTNNKQEIKKLYFSFNSDSYNPDVINSLKNIKSTIIEIFDPATQLSTQDKIFHLMANLIANNNPWYDFKRNALTFIDRTIDIFLKKKCAGTELTQQQENYINEGKELKVELKKIDFKDLENKDACEEKYDELLKSELSKVAAKDEKKCKLKYKELKEAAIKKIEVLDTKNTDSCKLMYLKLINYFKTFLSDEMILKDKFILSPDAENIQACLFKVYRIYLDCKKLVELLPNYYQFKFSEDIFYLIDNPRSEHAEINVIDQVPEKSGGLITRNIKQHLGISKLSCQICYDVFTEMKIVDNLLGCHGLTTVNSWGLPTFFCEPNNAKYFLTKFISKIVETLSNAESARIHPLRQDADLSDDEAEFADQTDLFHNSIKEVVVLGDLENILKLNLPD